MTSSLVLQTSTRILLLWAIAVDNINARVGCGDAPPEVGQMEKNIRRTTAVFNVTVIPEGKTVPVYQDQTPFHTLLPLGNYTIIVGMKFSSGTLAMAYFVDGRLTWTSPCVDLNRHANIPLTIPSKVNANITAYIMWRDKLHGRPTESLAAMSLFVPPPPPVNGSASGQPSTAPHNTSATAGATIIGTPAPHLANTTTKAGTDQARTAPAREDFSIPAHNCTEGAGHKGCVSDQPLVASPTNDPQPANAAASSPEVSSSTGAIVGGAIGSVVASAIIVLLSI